MKAKTPFARTLRKNQTEAEKLLWSKLRNRQVINTKFHRQYILGKYILDFVSFTPRLVIELDGGQHAEKIQKEKDVARDDFLVSQGFHVLRFWNSDILMHVDEVLTVSMSI